MSRKFSVVTTFNQSGYYKYGKRMINTFLQNWPKEVDLYVYAENCLVEESASNLHVLDLHATIPELVAFKQQWGTVPMAIGQVPMGPPDRKGKQPGIGFKWDAVRFSHKVYSVCHAAKNVIADVLLWMDADIVCHSKITLQELENFCPEHTDLAFLGREGKYTECGLYAMKLTSSATHKFLQDFQQAYDCATDGIFKMREWHDSFVFDQIRKQVNLAELDWSQGLIKGEGHPLINSPWGAYLDHLKGARKDLGRSKAKDLRVHRKESYWQ